MATVIIKENSKQAKDLIAYIKNLPFVKFLNEEKTKKEELNEETVRAIEEVRRKEGINKTKNSADLFKQLGI